MSDDGEKGSKSFSGHTTTRWNQFNQTGTWSGKKYSSLNKEHDIFKRYSEVYDKEHLYERLKRTKEDNMELKNENQKLKTRIMQLERQQHKLIQDQYGKHESKLIIDSQNLQRELDDKNHEIAELKRKDKISKCQELEIEIAKYIDECKRLRDMIIAHSEENTKLQDTRAINQFHGFQKHMSQVQNGNKHLTLKCDNYKKRFHDEQESTKKQKDHIDKLETEIERLKMQIQMMKHHHTAVISSNNKAHSKLDLTADDKYIYQKEKSLLTRIIEKQKHEIKKLKNIIIEEKAATLTKTQDHSLIPLDIRMIIYALKQQMVKNLFNIRQLAHVFENELDPLEENINKQQIKQKLKKWPFQLLNESHLIRFIEWINKEQSYLPRNEFLKKFQSLLLPYPSNAYTEDDIELVNLYLRNNQETILQQASNGYMNIIQLMDTIHDIMPQQYSNIFQNYILDQYNQLDKIPVSSILEPMNLSKVRSKSSSECKRVSKASPLSSIKYRPDYHYRRYGNTAQVSPVNFMEFYK